MWDPTTSFETAIGPIGRQSGINLLALRTCKADVVVGLKPGQDEMLRVNSSVGSEFLKQLLFPHFQNNNSKQSWV
jgi:hypothetical protein